MKIQIFHKVVPAATQTGPKDPIDVVRNSAARSLPCGDFDDKKVCQTALRTDPVACYDNLVGWMRTNLEPGSIVIVHDASSQGDAWNLLNDHGWTTLIGWLILAFPDIRWVIPNLSCFALDTPQAHSEWPLTDGSGLREFIKSQTLVKGKPWFPRRELCFAALDEEQDFAFFNAYTAFRFGYRSFAPLSWNEATEVMKSDLAGVFEDVFLQFPDLPTNKALSTLEERDKELPALVNVPARILVTSGGRDRLNGLRGPRELQNANYLSQRPQDSHLRIVSKPLAGMFRLWTQSKLPEWIAKQNIALASSAVSSGPSHYSAMRAPGYSWPPEPVELDESPGNHSAPGKLLMIARTLLERAEAILSAGVSSVEEAVRGAVFATEALELLGDRTPTTALEALLVKHQLEVIAECQFIGVSHRIDLESRVRELQYEIQIACHRFSRKDRRLAALDAEVVILGKLVKVFQDNNQFDEELECIFYQRKAMASLMQRRSPPMGWCVGFGWHYLNWLVRKPATFLLAILGWLAVGALAFSFATAQPWDWQPGAFGHAVDAFFAGDGPPEDLLWSETDLSKWTVRLLTIMGLFHFGVFVSYIYTLISRK